jgi:serine/threonine protein kinase
VSSEPQKEPTDELIGRSIGSYRVERQLGKGGMGAVYLGVHPMIGSKVAIKFLHAQYKSDAKIVDRFYNEARAVNVIGHDNILKILDLSSTSDGLHYFVMEYLHGKSLQDLLRDGQPVPLEIAGPILLQVCDALEAAHRKGIVHRDLKPDNIYLISLNGKQNFVKVVDFGIARLTDDDGVSSGKTVTGMVMGTPAYMSPEQGSGALDQIDGRSDVYSLGIMMYQLATGELPFKGTNFGEILVGHLQLAPPPPHESNPAIPERYEQIILCCLEKMQDDRYQSMRELKAAIAECMDELEIEKGLPPAALYDEAPGDTVPQQRTPARTSKPPSRPSNPGARASSPGVRVSSPGRPRVSQPPTQMHVPARRRTGLMAALIGGGVAAAAVVSLVLVQNANERAERKARDDTRAARVAAIALAAKQEEEEKVSLSLQADPVDAEVAVSWPQGEKRGTAPLSVEVPRNAKVRFEVSKAGYSRSSMDVLADQPQSVIARLEKQAVAQAPPAATVSAFSDEMPRRAARRKAAAAKPDEPKAAKDREGLMELDLK